MSTIDWDAAAAEVVELLQRLLRIDSTNPPGNEEAVADFLAGLLAAEGIESRKLVSAPGRASLVADLASDTNDPPLVLLNHTDVVPVEADQWQVDPFAGLLKDGYVWGRGALDMKGMAALELVVLLTLKRQGRRLKRPLRFLAVADEEAGSEYGVEWLDRNHPELLDAAFVKPLPKELLDAMIAAKNLDSGVFTMRQIYFSELDLAYHAEGAAKDTTALAHKLHPIMGFPAPPGSHWQSGFGHLFGYDAGYYGYKWSEVFADDMFTRFQAAGPLNPELGREYRQKIYERGGSVDGDVLVRDFLGREPNNEAFLKNIGL